MVRERWSGAAGTATADTRGNVWSALFFDGRNAQAHRVRVRFGEEGLHIACIDGGEPQLWAYAELVSSGPLVTGQPAVVGLKSRPGARLQVADETFCQTLLQRAPQLGTRAHWRRQQREVWAVLGGMAVIVVLFFLLPIPWARMGAALMPDSAWQSLGEQLRPLLAQRPCEQPQGLAALEAIETRLKAGLAAAGLADRQSRIVVAKIPMINAFTLPGGHIVISLALVHEAASPEELAGVMAHEIGHAIARHPEAGIMRGIGITGLVAVLTGGGSVLADQMAHLVMLKYSRDAEREADHLAMQILKGAEVDPEGLARFFARMRRKTGDGPPAVLGTHPPNRERMEMFRSLSGQWPTRPLLDDAGWQTLKRICG